MVLFVEPYGEGVKRLRRWGRRAGFAYLFNWYWRPSVVVWVRFTSKKPSGEVDLDMGMELAAETARIMQYLYPAPEQAFVFSLVIRDEWRFYYGYDWCKYSILAPSGESLINTCRIDNYYDYRSLGKQSLKPSRSLYTVVPSQLSGFV